MLREPCCLSARAQVRVRDTLAGMHTYAYTQAYTYTHVLILSHTHTLSLTHLSSCTLTHTQTTLTETHAHSLTETPARNQDLSRVRECSGSRIAASFARVATVMPVGCLMRGFRGRGMPSGVSGVRRGVRCAPRPIRVHADALSLNRSACAIYIISLADTGRRCGTRQPFVLFFSILLCGVSRPQGWPEGRGRGIEWKGGEMWILLSSL